ncbi:MAG: DUF4340 domain-containing protein [Gammaproteobacteria bacterium]|nr:DUF4340 domain-containing protein [Gammaproteobacteria bacterium]MDJ0872132.1 DUF4340 domain-containing protein [Gammaproteobacteria bacterium]MDJ0890433.1 DUF4340 domain-containing protein [Gammaproteobacteria bacterium]
MMRPRTLLNLALVAVVTALILLAVYEPGIQAPEEPERLTGKQATTVQRLRMQRPDQPDMRFEKRAAAWHMLEPYQLPANSLRVGAIPDIVEAASQAQFPAESLALERFSLDPPNASLFVDDIRIDFGGSEQLNAMRYVLLGDTVHLINDRFYHHLLSTAASLVDHRLLEPDAQPVEIVLQTHRLTLANGTWTVVPEMPQMSADAPVRVVEAWRNAQAIEVTALQSEKAEQSIEIHLRGKAQPVRYLVSAAEHAVVFARPDVGVQYHLSQASAEPLLRIRTDNAEVDEASRSAPRSPAAGPSPAAVPSR